MTWLWVFIGGGLGSMARFGISNWAPAAHTGSFPLATLLSNLGSSLLLGLFIGVSASRPESFNSWRFLVAVGFCGGFSTFSAFSAETFALFRHGLLSTALINIAANVLGTVTFTGTGMVIGKMWS